MVCVQRIKAACPDCVVNRYSLLAMPSKQDKRRLQALEISMEDMMVIYMRDFSNDAGMVCKEGYYCQHKAKSTRNKTLP